MHISLTDVLTCPRCGPEFGLILLAERVERRRALEGALACANCRERYAVRDGYAELRPGGALESGTVAERGSAEEAFRLAALLDLTDVNGLVLVLGAEARMAPALAGLAEHIEIVVTDPAVRAWEEEAGVSRISAGSRLPFFHRAFRGVALTEGAEADVAEAARVVAPMGRLVVEGAEPGAGGELEKLGFEVLLRSGDVMVARRKYV